MKGSPSRRYSQTGSNEEALDLLKKLAGTELDQDCVEALVLNLQKVEEVQSRFKEEASVHPAST